MPGIKIKSEEKFHKQFESFMNFDHVEKPVLKSLLAVVSREIDFFVNTFPRLGETPECRYLFHLIIYVVYA